MSGGSRTSSSSSSGGGGDNDDDDSDVIVGASGRPGVVVVGPRYAGQDLRPTSARELLGWWSYAFAAETYPVCG